MRRKDVVRLHDTNAAAVRFANYRVQVLRALFEHARDEGWRDDNPTKGVLLLPSEGKARQPWPQEAIEDFRAAAPIGTRARLWVPLTPTPRKGLTILIGRDRRPLSYRAARSAVMDVRKLIDAEAHDLHALRYSAASEFAAAGCTDEQIEAITGDATAAMIRRYAGPARQKARATEAQKTRK